MALLPNLLIQNIKTVFTAQHRNVGTVANEIAMAYYTYAQLANASLSTPVFTRTEMVRLQQFMLPALQNNRSGTPAVLANAITNGIESFWLLPPVQFVGAQTGPVTAFPGKAALLSSLISTLSNPNATLDSVSQGIGNALHAATITITVTLAPPPGTIVTLL